MQRVRQPIRGNRLARGLERLGRDLAPVEREALAGARLVLAAEEVPVERLELQE